MGLELLIGGPGQGEGDRGEAADAARRDTGGLTDLLADAARQTAGVRERLQAMIDRTADLGRRMHADGGSDGDGPQRRPPELATE
jgi:hypothetical protein